MKTAYIFLADGFEDIEALGTRDVLVRAGIDTRTVSITDDPFVLSSHGITVGVDTVLELLDGFDKDDVLVCPGGMPGSKNLAACSELIGMMNEHYKAGGTVAAICAAPGLVLTQLDNISGLEMTCFDGFEDNLKASGVRFVPKAALTCGNIITGRGSGHSIDFGLEIVKKMEGESAAKKVRSGMILTVCE